MWEKNHLAIFRLQHKEGKITNYNSLKFTWKRLMELYPLSGASCVILVVVAFLARLLDDYSIIILQRTFSRVRKIKPIYFLYSNFT